MIYLNNLNMLSIIYILFGVFINSSFVYNTNTDKYYPVTTILKK